MSDLFLGPLDPEHLPQIQEWRNRPETRAHVREWRYLTMEHLKAWYADQLVDPYQEYMGVFQSAREFPDEPATLVGVVGLTDIHWINRTAEISVLCPDVPEDTQGYILDMLLDFARMQCNLASLTAETYTPQRADLVKRCRFTYAGECPPVWKLGAFRTPKAWWVHLPTLFGATADVPPESAPAIPRPDPSDSP